MPTGIKALQTEELIQKQYRAQMERDHQAKLYDMNQKFEEELKRLQEEKESQIVSMRSDYDIRISKEAELLNDRLEEVREAESSRIDEVRKESDALYQRTLQNGKEKVAQVQNSLDNQLDKMRRDAKISTDQLQAKEAKAKNRILDHAAMKGNT